MADYLSCFFPLSSHSFSLFRLHRFSFVKSPGIALANTEREIHQLSPQQPAVFSTQLSSRTVAFQNFSFTFLLCIAPVSLTPFYSHALPTPSKKQKRRKHRQSRSRNGRSFSAHFAANKMHQQAHNTEPRGTE